MAFLKRWKTNWELKSLTFDQLFSVIVKVITKQLDEIEEDSVKLEANLVIDYEADSVDIVGVASEEEQTEPGLERVDGHDE